VILSVKLIKINEIKLIGGPGSPGTIAPTIPMSASRIPRLIKNTSIGFWLLPWAFA